MSYEMCSQLLKATRDSSMRGVEQVWAFTFAAAGKIRRPRYELWHTPGGQRVLVVAPHPDDETIGCAGVIAQHSRAGDDVCVVYITDGRRSRALGLTPEAMAKQRRAEATVAMRVLNVTGWEWFGLREGEWDLELGAARLRKLLMSFKPDLIYAPSRVDFHPEHLQVAQIVAQSLAPTAVVRVYPIQVPLTPLLANCIAPVGGEYETIRNALHAYASQRASVLRALRLRHYTARRYGIFALAEEFWQMRGAVYTRLHTLPFDTLALNYFGLRHLPLTDPLAYLRGVSARRALAKCAGERQ
jgi:LmbE family N-acetylglucosaminyl deacetylase